MAIRIFCDLCGKERETTQIKGVEPMKGSAGVWFSDPRMDHQHFVCLECLAKIGLAQTGNNEPDAAYWANERGADGDGTTRDHRDAKIKRRRGVTVLLTWKTEGGFEVCNSIAAAVDRIAEKTGKVIQGADISHALLKEKIYNADTFMVKYANEANEANEANGANTQSANPNGQDELKWNNQEGENEDVK